MCPAPCRDYLCMMSKTPYLVLMTYSRLGSGASGGNVVGLQSKEGRDPKRKMEKTQLCYLRLDRVFTLQPLYIIIKLHARIFILSHAFIEWLDHKTLVLLHPITSPQNPHPLVSSLLAMRCLESHLIQPMFHHYSLFFRLHIAKRYVSDFQWCTRVRARPNERLALGHDA